MCLHLFEPPFIPLHTLEWQFDQRFCYFPKEDFFWGHPVELMKLKIVYHLSYIFWSICEM